MQVKYGTYEDWRPNGWFASLMFGLKSLTIQFRPTYWVLYTVCPPGKPGTIRLYIGPFEFQYTNYKNAK